MVGLLILKQLENLSDESIVLQWKWNPYHQAFCGIREIQQELPCHIEHGVLVHFASTKITNRLNKIGPAHGISQRRTTFVKEVQCGSSEENFRNTV